MLSCEVREENIFTVLLKRLVNEPVQVTCVLSDTYWTTFSIEKVNYSHVVHVIDSLISWLVSYVAIIAEKKKKEKQLLVLNN